MSARFALCPKDIAGAAEKCKFSAVKRFFKRLAVRITHHKDLTAYALRNYRNHGGFLPVQAADKRIFKRNFAGIKRHSKLNVAAFFFKLFDFVFRGNASCNDNSAFYCLSQFFRHLHIRSLHTAFFFNAGKQKFRTVFFCLTCAFHQRYVYRFRPPFYSDFSVYRIHRNNNPLPADCLYKFLKKFGVHNRFARLYVFFPGA